MITIPPIELSNEGAEAARSEIQQFLRFENERMTLPGERGNPALGYVVLRKFLGAIDSEIARVNAKAEAVARAKQPPPPTVREERGR